MRDHDVDNTASDDPDGLALNAISRWLPPDASWRFAPTHTAVEAATESFAPLTIALPSFDSSALDRLASLFNDNAWHIDAFQPFSWQAPALPIAHPLATNPSITVSDAIAGESDGMLTFVVTLSAASTDTVSVSYSNTNATAANGSDYVAQTGTVTFTPGQTSQTVQIPLIDNATAEGTEYLKLNIFNAVNGTIVRQFGWGTIVDNDTAAGTPVVRVIDQVVDEAAGTVTFSVALDRPATGAVSVDVATANGTALAGSDYVAKALTTLNFAPGQVVKTVTVTLTNDAAAEGSEYFDLVLSNGVGVTLLAEPHGRATIGANDATAVASPLITVSDAAAGENEGYLTFVVSLSAPSTGTVTVNYSNSNLTAANGSDYQAQSGTLTFVPGQTTQTVLVPLLDNATAENTEFLTLNLTSATGGTIVRQYGWGSIVDNDAPSGTPVVRVSDQVVDEAAGTVTFTVTLDRPSTGTVKVDYATADGTATAGSDYTASGLHTLSFVAGEVCKTVTVDLINDASAEGAQYFDLLLSNAIGATLLAEAHGRTTIGANDATAVASPLITVSDATACEVDGYMEFVVSLSAPSTQAVSVSYSNSNVTALNGSDYQALSGTLTFAPGQTTQTVRIPVLDNATQEASEYLTLNLFSAVNGSIVRQAGWGTIVDNDAPSGTPVVRVGDQVVDEAAGTVTFTVSLDRPSTGLVKVDYATANGTANAGSDYVATGTHTLSFLAGETSKTVTVDLVNDGSTELAQYFDLALSNAVGATLMPETHGRATIGANDATPVGSPLITVSDAIAGESDGVLTFVVSLSAPSNQAVSVNYSNSNLTAANGSDYVARSGTLTFAPGETTQVVQIAVLDNATLENNEFLTLNLTSAVNGTIVRQFGWGTVVDNDQPSGTPVLRVGDQVVDEAAGTVSVTVTLDKPSTGAVQVNYATAAGSAKAGSDFTATGSHTLSFLPGEITKTITIDLTNDSTNEPGEYFDLLFSSPVGATLPDANARIFIAPSDAAAVATPTVSVSDASVSETDGYLEFVVSLSAPSTQNVSVNYSNSNLTAANGSDYQALSGTLTFVPGQTTQIVRIPVLDNATAEATEFLTLNLGSAVNATIVRQYGWGSIADNDATTGAPALSVGDGIVDEATGRVTFTITLDKPSTSQVSVNYATADGTASSKGGDYEAQAKQTLVFAPGEVSKTVTVDLLGDTTNESTEYFDLVLSGALNATIADARGHLFIPQNDGTTSSLPTISAAAISAQEGGGFIEFVVSLSAPSTSTVSVSYSNANGTAANGSDYQALSGVLTFTPGQTTQIVRMPVLDDLSAESTETFKLNLFSPVNGQVGTSEVVASIIDNDSAPPPGLVDFGTGNADVLIGRPGANEVEGGAGNDALDGVNGVVMRGGAGNDLYIVESASDSVTELAGEGTDRVASYVNYTLGANVENLSLFGSASKGTGNGLNNSITGNAADNTLTGLAGKDVLNGGKGADLLIGGADNDTYVVDNAGDVATELAGEGTDTLQSSITRTLDANIEALTLTGKLAIDGTGNTLANTLIGNAAANVLDGGDAADSLTGNAGTDTFVFASLTGADTVADFSGVDDTFRIGQAGIHIGDGDTAVENAVVRAAPGGFSTSAELVIFTTHIAGAIDAASAAAQIGSATSAYALGADVLFVVDNGTQSGLFRFHSSGTDALVTAAELTQVALVNGDLTGLSDYTFGP
ncbi:beta strand repeat-containing protein [Ideonella sp.]|uniref:beta strand repeat-containing protein n=1 Tax=Ideonella sp. TaxID=1929293 RepID=UPI0035B0BFDB